MLRNIFNAIMLASVAALAGCGGPFRTYSDPPADWVKPTIAVMKFENRAPAKFGWDLGDGMRDVLVDRLVATKRFHVIERAELAEVVRELQLQNSGATRPQRRAQPGRLKNVQYLIKGTVTDFGHVSTKRGGARLFQWDLLGGSERAVIGMTVYVVEVESGQIVCSESLEESLEAGDTTVQATYSDVAFGGSSFYRTPLGRATAHVIDEAVGRVLKQLPQRTWQPRLALVAEGGSVVLNGGKDRNVREGSRYEVFRKGEPILDPETGDVIGTQPGVAVGTVEVTEIRDRCAVARIVTGDPADFQTGQHCRAMTSEPVASSPGR